MQSNNYHVDYSEFYLKAQKEFKNIEKAVNKKDYQQAEKHALTAMVEMKLLWNSLQILKDKHKELWKNAG